MSLDEIPADQLLTPSFNSKRVLITHGGLPKGSEITDADIETCHLEHIWMRWTTIKSSRIKHCYLKHVNLRNAKLQQVDFTGTRFENCNLAYTEFSGCCFWYSEFDRCKLNYDSIIRNLPGDGEENLRRNLLRSLRVNAVSECDSPRANSLLLLELKAERMDLFNRFWHTTEYYKDYQGLDRVLSFSRWIGHCIEAGVWGYGLRLWNLAAFLAIVIFLLTMLTWTIGGTYNLSGGPSLHRSLSFGESLYFTIVNVCTVGFGDIVPADTPGKVLASVTSLVGALSWGFVVAALYRRAAR